MTLLELLAVVVDELNRVAIPHMICGSLASTYHGEPRMTQDIDVVIDPDPDALASFVDHLDRSRFYVGDATAALERRDQFNVVDTTSGWKVDFIIRKERPFSLEEFDRRLPADIGGVATFVATPEDTILAKLEWAEGSGSERQLRDVVGVLSVTEAVDADYLRRWASALGIQDALDLAFRLVGEAGD